MVAQKEALRVLKETSRTFFIPVSGLPDGLQEAVASGYLCMRAIDEIEDHPEMKEETKADLLKRISQVLQAQTSVEDFAHNRLAEIFDAFKDFLPEVSTRIGEWACYAPKFIAPRVWESTSSMADRMAHWAATSFKVITLADLDRYTYSVAGAVGLLLCDLWAWFEKIQINRSRAIQFGRGLQLVNILRNHTEDLERGVDFYPEGWADKEMHAYAISNLNDFDDYTKTLPRTTFLKFVSVPRALAYATLDALARGEEKLTRKEVVQIVRQLETE
ncbi:MAG: phytoene/squalene synthase family protein [Chloroflexi bacterium]|nr:phytoene/squalene synthase family protein [Chloroflexota bacterium]